MDENNLNNNVGSTQSPIQQPPQPQPTQPQAAPGEVKYASFWQRLGALIVDIIIVGFVIGILGALTGTAKSSGGYNSNPFSILALVYYVFMDVKYGATLGKMALHLRVQNEQTGQNLTVVEAILRELVGKFLSSLVLFLGYFWVLWDPKKQGWHDKIAKSVVVVKEK